jgi:AcrR family transcriptional regulator
VSQPSARSGRLSVDDWIGAALEIMAADGIGGVKIQRLCDMLGVTKGSFYWHFKDLDAFLDAIAERWREGEGTIRRRLDEAVRTDPKGALLDGVTAFVDTRLGRLERAMRDWSRSDDRARAAIKVADERTFDALVSGFETLGFERREADVRAKILFYAGVGFGDVGPIGDRSAPARQLETLVDLLTTATNGSRRKPGSR